MLTWISDLLRGLLGMVVDVIAYPLKTMLIYPIVSYGIKMICSLLYTTLCMPFYLWIDFMQMFFRRICGLEGSLSIGNGGSDGLGSVLGEGEDLVMGLISSKAVQDIFLAFSLIALILLFISTIIAIIKTEYNFDKEGNSKGPIFARAIKAIALYFTIPVACLFGMYFSNMMLKAVDQATSNGSNSTISGLLFTSSVQRASRLETSQSFVTLYQHAPRINGYWYFNSDQKVEGGRVIGAYGNENSPFSLLEDTHDSKSAVNMKEARRLSKLITAAFASGETNYDKFNFKTIASTPFDGLVQAGIASKGYKNPVDGLLNATDGAAHLFSLTPLTLAGFSIYNLELINFYYDFLAFDFLQVMIVGAIVGKALGDLTIGVAKRLYEMVVLFVISPPAVALMPLDGGSAYKSWVKAFMSRVFSLYGGVLAINFFFMISPIVCSIEFFNITEIAGVQVSLGAFLSYMPSLVMITAGALSIKSISKMISDLIGSNDSLGEGAAMSKEVASTIGSAVSTVSAGAKGGFKAFKGMAKGGGGGGGEEGGGGEGGGGGGSAEEQAASVADGGGKGGSSGGDIGESPLGGGKGGDGSAEGQASAVVDGKGGAGAGGKSAEDFRANRAAKNAGKMADIKEKKYDAGTNVREAENNADKGNATSKYDKLEKQESKLNKKISKVSVGDKFRYGMSVTGSALKKGGTALGKHAIGVGKAAVAGFKIGGSAIAGASGFSDAKKSFDEGAYGSAKKKEADKKAAANKKIAEEQEQNYKKTTAEMQAEQIRMQAETNKLLKELANSKKPKSKK